MPADPGHLLGREPLYAWSAPTAAIGSLGVGASQAREMSTSRYLLWLVIIGVVLAPVLIVTKMVGVPTIGYGFAGIALIIITLTRLELGLLILAALIPWEVQTVLVQRQLTAIRLVGYIVAGIGIPLVVMRRGSPKWPAMMTSAALFASVAMLSTIPNWSIPTATSYLSLLSNILFLYLLMRAMSTPAAWTALVIVICVSMIGQAFLGLGSSSVAQEGLLKLKWLAIGTYVKGMMVGVFLLAFLVFQARSWTLRLALIAGIFLCLLVTLLTGSRAGVAGFVVGGVVFLFTLKQLDLRQKLLILVLMGLVSAAVLFVAAKMGMVEMWELRIASIGKAADARFLRWKAGIEIALSNPLLGIGFGNEPFAFARRGLWGTEAHNDILSALMRTGILGLLCYMGVLLMCLWDLWRRLSGVMRSSLLGMWTAILVYGLVQPSLKQKIFWLAAGVCASAIVAFREQARAPAASGAPAAPWPTYGPLPPRAPGVSGR